MKAIFYPILILVVFSFITSCGTDSASTKTEETPTANDSSLQGTQLSAESRKMLNAMVANPNNHNQNGSHANRIAKEYLKNNQSKKAIDILKKGVILHSTSNSTPLNITMLLETYKSNPNSKTSYINFIQSLQIGNPTHPNLDSFAKDIPKGEKPVKEKIETIRNSLTNTSTGRLDLKKVNEFVNIIELFVMANPTNDQSPEYLKLGAEVVNSVKVYPRAIQFYDWILSKYPNSKQAPQALFMKGFTLDDGMKKKLQAKPVYEEFLRKYPKNDFADDTKFLLKNINKSDEEIIKQFEEKK